MKSVAKLFFWIGVGSFAVGVTISFVYGTVGTIVGWQVSPGNDIKMAIGLSILIGGLCVCISGVLYGINKIRTLFPPKVSPSPDLIPNLNTVAHSLVSPQTDSKSLAVQQQSTKKFNRVWKWVWTLIALPALLLLMVVEIDFIYLIKLTSSSVESIRVGNQVLFVTMSLALVLLGASVILVWKKSIRWFLLGAPTVALVIFFAAISFSQIQQIMSPHLFSNDCEGSRTISAADVHADPVTFISLNCNYGKDAAHAYSFWARSKDHVVEGADTATFTALGHNFAKDSQRAYSLDLPLVGADAASFRVINLNYAVDAQHAYFLSEVITDADVSTFTNVDGAVLAKDARHVYRMGKILMNADAATFISLGPEFSKDAYAVYYNDYAIPGADAATFRVSGIFGEKGNDKSHTYSIGFDSGILSIDGVQSRDYITHAMQNNL